MKKIFLLTVASLIALSSVSFAQDTAVVNKFSTVVVFGANITSSPEDDLGIGFTKGVVVLRDVASHFKAGVAASGTSFGGSATDFDASTYSLTGVYHNHLAGNLGFFLKFGMGASSLDGQAYEFLQVTGGGLYYPLSKDVTLIGGGEGSFLNPEKKTTGTLIYGGVELAPF